MDLFSGLNEEEKRIFNHLQKNGPLTKKAIQDELGYSAATLNRFMNTLLEGGLAEECGQDASSGGRRPSLFDVCRSAGYMAGIDISRDSLQIVITDLKLNIVARYSIGVYRNPVPGTEGAGIPPLYSPYDHFVYETDPHVLLDYTAQTLNELLALHGISHDRLLGIGISMVGPLDPDTGLVGKVNYFFEYAKWEGVDLKAFFASRFDVPVWVECGSSLAAMVEMLYGKMRGAANLAFVSCGIGLRIAQVSNGRLIRPVNNDDGAFEHLIINPFGERCTCGKRGCVRAYASTFTISANVRARILNGEPCLIDKPIESINYADIAYAAEQGDPLCIHELEEAARYLGLALSNYYLIVNPDVIIIGGKLASVSKVFYNKAVETVVANLPASESILPVFSQGGSFAFLTMSVGAAALVLEKSLGSQIL